MDWIFTSLSWLTSRIGVSPSKLLYYGTSLSVVVFVGAETYKCLPLSYSIRLFALLFRQRFFPRKLFKLDVPIVKRSRVRLSDLDYHGHVNNAQYALDADLYARYPWISAVLMNTGTPYRGNAFIGGTVYFFMREMRWGCRYRIETQAVACDKKWVYTESRWYVENTRSGKASGSINAADRDTNRSADPLAAVQLTRFVLKEGSGPLRGKTIPPREAFKDLGMAVPDSFEENSKIGDLFTQAYDVATGSQAALQQILGDCCGDKGGEVVQRGGGAGGAAAQA